MKFWRYVPAAIVLILLGAYYYWQYGPLKVVAPYSADNPMSSYDFVTTYKADWEKADKLYRGKILFLRGMVGGHEDFGNSGGISLIDLERPQEEVTCWMGDIRERDKALRGRIATVRGKVRGGTSLLLEEPCELVSLSDVPKRDPMPSAELIQAYKTDPAAAAKRYEGKVLFVRGRVSEAIEETIGPETGKIGSLALRDKDDDDYLLCSLLELRDGDGIKKEQIVVVRGRVQGANDLIHCVVVEK
jgi:tRNA_anti-like